MQRLGEAPERRVLGGAQGIDGRGHLLDQGLRGNALVAQQFAPEEIHRLAGKTRRAMGAGRGQRATCHSEVASNDEAHELQSRELDPVTLQPLGG